MCELKMLTVTSDYIKAATGWLVFASGVDLGRSQVLSGPPDRR